MIRSLLIANRGEIACRIIRTARSMGIRTIAVYSEADAGALHVREADQAVLIGPPPVSESYLLGERIIAAALETGAEAIHPGYGFLSENADFAQAVIDAGLIWVGAPPAAITAMGLKDAAKALMQAAGVPVTPGYLGEDQSPERLFAEAQAIGWPVLIKAVAGGGGKGMRRVDAAADFAEALEACRREARASFGNDRVILEKWITAPRHIEVQIFGDSHGQVVHLFERDCSLQRRHQKVIEEAPAPGMDEATRTQLCAAAVRAAQAVDYVGAGTVEFIADVSHGTLSADRIWFMEMNTRLQVEHPVTEGITGVDLVEWQLRVASGEPLPQAQGDLSINGWAMEARLYAEDPARGFLPSTGVLELAHFADGYDIRVETGVEDGDQITPFYDPMIAKLVAFGDTREAAIETLASQLETGVVWPVKTNAAFLLACLRDADFIKGGVTTGHIANHVDTLTITPQPQESDWQAAAQQLWLQSMPAQKNAMPGPWTALDGFRANGPRRLFVTLQQGTDQRQVDLSTIDVADDHPYLIPVSDGLIALRDGQPLLFQIPRNNGSEASDTASGSITSPMPGRVIAVAVAAGDRVQKGQKLLTLEAMKMEHSLTAPFDGVVAELGVSEGQQVQVDALLARVEQHATEPAN